jgi:rubrerythrin
MAKNKGDEQKWYICGQCKDPQYYLVGEEPPVPCPDCGYHHKGRDYRDVPPEIKVDLGAF